MSNLTPARGFVYFFAARIALGITTVLTMTTLTNSARESLPKVSYVKSIEWFLIICFMYVFASLVEYACVSFEVNRRLKRGMEISPLQPESDDGKVKATTDLIDYIFLCVVSYTCQLNRDDVFLSDNQTPGKGQA